jgi:hypothetical protein
MLNVDVVFVMLFPKKEDGRAGYGEEKSEREAVR